LRSQLFIFDLDGTIIDSREDITSAINFIRGRFGLPKLSSSDVVRHSALDFHHLIEKTVITDIPDTDLDATVGGFRVYYKKNMLVHTKPYPGVLAHLKKLKEAGARLAVASNKPVKLTREILDQLKMIDLFDAIMGPEVKGNGISSRTKLFLATANALKAKPSRCIVIGGIPEDIKAAKSAKMKACGVIWGFGKEKALKSAGADAVMVSPAEWMDFLNPRPRQVKKPAKKTGIGPKVSKKTKITATTSTRNRRKTSSIKKRQAR